MANFKKETKLKYVAAGDTQTMWLEYMREREKIVSKRYTKWGNQYLNVYKNMKIAFKTLTFEQFENELRMYKEDVKSEGESWRAYGKTLDNFIRNLVHEDIKYTINQDKAVHHNLNEAIKKVWEKAVGRSVRGKTATSITFNTLNLTEGERELLNVMILNKGDGLNYDAYLLTVEDVVGQRYYFKQVYNCVYYNGLMSRDDLYHS